MDRPIYKQYIGARYVPKFFENSSTGDNTWAENVGYEPLTIVKWNEAFYTSKKVVPNTVGAPNLNTEYWVLTGNYNAQIADLTNRVDTLEHEIDDLSINVHCIENVGDFEELTDVAIGDIVRTKWFANKTSGGGAYYEVVESGTEDDVTVFTNGKLYFQYIPEAVIRIDQLGAEYGEDVDSVLDYAIAIASNSKKPIVVPNGNYVLTRSHTLPEGVCITGITAPAIGDLVNDVHFDIRAGGLTLSGENRIEGVNFRDKTNQRTVTCLTIASSRNSVFNCEFIYLGNAIYLPGKTGFNGQNRFYKCEFHYCNIGINATTTGSNPSTDNEIRDCITSYCQYFFKGSGSTPSVIGCHDYSDYGCDFGDVDSIQLIGNYFDLTRQATACVKMNIANDFRGSVIGNSFYINGSAEHAAIVNSGLGVVVVVGNVARGYGGNLNALVKGKCIINNNGTDNGKYIIDTSSEDIRGLMTTSLYQYKFALGDTTTNTFYFPKPFTERPILLGGRVADHSIFKDSYLTNFEVYADKIVVTKSSAGAYNGSSIWLVFTDSQLNMN